MVNTQLPTMGMSVGDSYFYYEKYKSLFREGYCYNNAFALMAELLREDIRTTCQIGYVLSSDGTTNLAIRHCWLKDKYNAVIDVSVPAAGYPMMGALNLKYVPVVTFTPKEWLNRIDKDNGSLDAWDNKNEDSVVKSLENNGFTVKRVKAEFN